MTFSIAARCARTGQVGVGAITAMMGIGKLASHARAGVGAVATQANTNPYLGFDGLRCLVEGLDAPATLDRLIAADPGRDYRQCGIVDARGGAAAWSGSMTPSWSGHLTGPDYAAQGNRLVGRETLEEVAGAFRAAEGRPLAERILLALEAGEATGADREGATSGVVYVMDREEYPLWDVRIDHDADPAAALRRLFDEMARDLVPLVRRLSTRDDPVGDLTREQMRADGRSPPPR